MQALVVFGERKFICELREVNVKGRKKTTKCFCRELKPKGEKNAK